MDWEVSSSGTWLPRISWTSQNPLTWLEKEPYQLVLDFLNLQPDLCKELQSSKQHDLQYGLTYVNAIQCIRDSAYHAKPGLRGVHHNASLEEVHAHEPWDDNVERVEFYREHTLLSCGSRRFHRTVADRLCRKEDVLRQNPDCALLYYTLVRVSIENDEMMQDASERALNKIFARLMNNRSTRREHVESIFSLQQAVLDGLEDVKRTSASFQYGEFHPLTTTESVFIQTILYHLSSVMQSRTRWTWSTKVSMRSLDTGIH